jgi:hypothetical protein
MERDVFTSLRPPAARPRWRRDGWRGDLEPAGRGVWAGLRAQRASSTDWRHLSERSEPTANAASCAAQACPGAPPSEPPRSGGGGTGASPATPAPPRARATPPNPKNPSQPEATPKRRSTAKANNGGEKCIHLTPNPLPARGGAEVAGEATWSRLGGVSGRACARSAPRQLTGGTCLSEVSRRRTKRVVPPKPAQALRPANPRAAGAAEPEPLQPPRRHRGPAQHHPTQKTPRTHRPHCGSDTAERKRKAQTLRPASTDRNPWPPACGLPGWPA